jgi:hypothetical protein
MTNEEALQFKRVLRTLAETRKELASVTTLHPAKEYHEDYGPVLWWAVPIQEPPYCGTSLDDGFDDDYYTHFSRIPRAVAVDKLEVKR